MLGLYPLLLILEYCGDRLWETTRLTAAVLGFRCQDASSEETDLVYVRSTPDERVDFREREKERNDGE